jgi:hypothetical protein
MREAAFCLGLLAALLACGPATRALERQTLLPNGGFEVVDGAASQGWAAFESGYMVSRDVHRRGRVSVLCRNLTSAERRGAVATITLNQRKPQPVLVSGFSRAADVGGFRNNDYSIYLDLTYVDGTPLWGQVAPFSTGTHDWERRQVLVLPQKPIRNVSIYALFRRHAGSAWFDDFSASVLDADSTFDGQAVAAPVLARPARCGWFVRDVSAGSGIVRSDAAGRALGIRCVAARAPRPWEQALRVSGPRGRTLCATIYYIERFPAKNARWWSDMRRSVLCGESGEHANLTHLGVGATGVQSLYPFACVTNGRSGRAVGVPAGCLPSVSRFGFHAGSSLLYAAFDVALTPDNLRNSAAGCGTAEVTVARWNAAPEWGFRSALARYYAMYAGAFRRRAGKDGLWIPFADPSTIEGLRDFGIAYHEGDNCVASDDRLGILSFRYTEPMTWWMPMPPATPRTYEAALALIREHLRSDHREQQRLAQAVIHSGSMDERGLFNVEFQNAPWTNGAVWNLNPNPRLPRPAGQATKASLSFGEDVIARSYGPRRDGDLDGEYLDSIEGWAEVLDYRAESLRHSAACPTFAAGTLRPVVPTWFSVWELASQMRCELMRRGKLLMANATPWRLHAFSGLLDVMGTETNWLPSGTWRPDGDEVFCLRRSLCYQKPYLLLQNTDFERFGPPEVERYMKRCMAYGVFPSMFSVDASTRNYWTERRWYDRDRELFKRYIPVIRRLSSAGWEPITHATTSDPRVFVERFGSRYLTVLNDSSARRSVLLRILPGAPSGLSRATTLQDAIGGTTFRAQAPAAGVGNVERTGRVYRVAMGPEECLVLRPSDATTGR